MAKRSSIFPTRFYLLLFVTFHCGKFADMYTGRDTGYEIVVPRKVGSDGKFVSHQIPHHFKRSLYAPADRGGGGRVEDDAVHYRLKIGQKDYHLELRPNPSLVAPGAVIEEHRGSAESGSNDNLLKDAKLKGMRDSQCHYLGRVHGHSGDSALSTCYGLVSPTFF
ncbi:A disintegrin and metalloproteinase with thrombospondin motifs 16-like [Apis cerana]|uniref:A disintegrin and metalloproteinase with thrombospondin motifs 16-like n=1 Tax=Apis cerana TaxID=7461 RepID=UPI002B23E171|nr:A disintegrin and metalloproteinase with thrombospondin motifs 16-like [Apis cerana]